MIARPTDLPALPDDVIERNLREHATPQAALSAGFGRVRARPLPERVAYWARFFLERGDAVYHFGDDPGGYVSEGRLVDDVRTDCMLLTTRVVELAHASGPREAIADAFRRRFPGVSPSEACRSGHVDYDHPKRVRFGIDMVRGGAYGIDVTSRVGSPRPDPGSSRIPNGEVAVVPRSRVESGRLRTGDIVYFVVDPESPAGARLRSENGALVGHIGVVDAAHGTPMLIHAASRDLPGEYAGGRVVSVALGTYLSRVETFSGILVTRFTATRAL